MKGVLCPVCNGAGVVYGIAETGACPTTPCHGCAEWGSRGWLMVPELDGRVLPMPYDGETDDGYKERLQYRQGGINGSSRVS